MAKLYATLRGLLTTNDYTQEQFARASGIPIGTLHDRLGGKYPWTLDEAYKALDLFRVPHDRLHEIFPKDGKRT